MRLGREPHAFAAPPSLPAQQMHSCYRIHRTGAIASTDRCYRIHRPVLSHHQHRPRTDLHQPIGDATQEDALDRAPAAMPHHHQIVSAGLGQRGQGFGRSPGDAGRVGRDARGPAVHLGLEEQRGDVAALDDVRPAQLGRADLGGVRQMRRRHVGQRQPGAEGLGQRGPVQCRSACFHRSIDPDENVLHAQPPLPHVSRIVPPARTGGPHAAPLLQSRRACNWCWSGHPTWARAPSSAR